MGYFSDMYDKALKKLEEAHTKAEEKFKGRTEGAIRERKADIALSARGGGYAKSPVEEALTRKSESLLRTRLNETLADLKSKYLGVRAGLEAKKGEATAQEKFAGDQARQAMFGNIITGLGSLAGTMIPGLNLVLPGSDTGIGSLPGVSEY